MPTILPITGARSGAPSKLMLIVMLLLYAACAFAMTDGILHNSAPLLEVAAAQAGSGL